MTVNQYIKDLLLNHDCIILPDFGAFIANPNHSGWEDKFILHPPYKKVAFNISIKNNDGLLANYIDQQENCSYAVAMSKVSTFTKEIRSALEQNKKFNLPGIGSFFTDSGKNILFETDPSMNFQLSSYGLSSITCKPLAELNNSLFRDRPAISSHFFPKKIHWKKLITVPVIALLICATYNTPGIEDSSLLYSSLNPFEDSNKSLKSKLISDVLKTETGPANFHAEKLIPAEKLEERYFIVAGCFANLGNAENMVQVLREKDFHAFISGKRKDMYVVSYDSFKSKEEASEKLKLVKAFENKSAWILFQ